MSTLAQQQSQLLDALFAWPAPSAIENIAVYAYSTGARGLKAYQSNGHMLAERALLAAYPVVACMLGAASFADLARALWHAHPSERGDLAQWGDALADFMAESPQLADVPYVPDVARLEWALHQCATAADAQADLPSLALLTDTDPDALTLRLAPGCAVLPSRYPTVACVLAHAPCGQSSPHSTSSSSTPTPEALADLAQRLQARQAQTAMVWRAGYKPQTRAALVGEADFVSTLLAGHSVGAALSSAPSLDVSHWLSTAVHEGLLLGVAPFTPPISTPT
jgi:Putative DNA-binding domain